VPGIVLSDVDSIMDKTQYLQGISLAKKAESRREVQRRKN
jgi:hypothetical protein